MLSEKIPHEIFSSLIYRPFFGGLKGDKQCALSPPNIALFFNYFFTLFAYYRALWLRTIRHNLDTLSHQIQSPKADTNHRHPQAPNAGYKASVF